MTAITIMQSADYKLISYGNGTAYAPHHHDKSVYVQGDDATEFRSELDMWQDRFPQSDNQETLGHMWHDLEYSLAATESAPCQP